jgi:hypothetical protein
VDIVKSCDSDWVLPIATPEQRASGRRWLIALFASKCIVVLSALLCGLVAWQLPDTFPNKIAVIWLGSSVICGWFFETLCFKKLARIMGDGNTWYRRDLRRRFAILGAFGALVYLM